MKEKNTMSTSVNSLWNGSKVAVSHQNDGSVKVRSINGHHFTIGTMPPATLVSEVPAQTVRAAAEANNELALEKYKIDNNPDLSELGRKNALAKPQKVALLIVAYLAQDLQAFRDGVDRREAKLFAVPEATNSPAQAITDVETRAWFNAQKDDFQLRILQETCVSHEGSDLIAPLLRGPFPALNPKIKAISETWQRARRAGNPTEAEAIDVQRSAADWAYKSLSMFAIMSLAACATMSKPEIIKILIDSQVSRDGFAIFAYTDKDVRIVKATIQNELQAA